ncbi:hypothetical protein DFQ27_002813 [Actinomortierella ambigua]|uniref:BTB domain-containing protein n=1 Tax=Actinomortierella ambigua TaxID=1343610 RepID=A0A9P6U5N9_9FUNG|nr:hypothetical protein DFQ27_002813 [Actinomortierella ambigua]
MSVNQHIRSFVDADKDTRMDGDLEMDSSTTPESLRIQCSRLDIAGTKSGQFDAWTFTLNLVDDEVIELVLTLKVMERGEMIQYKSLEVESTTYPGIMIYNRRLPLLENQSIMLVIGIQLNGPRSIFTEPMFCMAEKFYRDAGKTGNHIFRLTSTERGDIHRTQIAGHRTIMMTRPALARLIHESGFRRSGATVNPHQQAVSSMSVGLNFHIDHRVFREVVRYIYCRQRPENLMFDIALEGLPYGCWGSYFQILDTLGVQDLFELSLSVWRTYLTQESALQNYRLWAFRYPAIVQTLAQFVVAHASEPYEGHKMITYMTYVADRCSDVDFLPVEPHKTLMMHIAALKSAHDHLASEQ